jgi:hypothetical protein
MLTLNYRFHGEQTAVGNWPRTGSTCFAHFSGAATFPDRDEKRGILRVTLKFLPAGRGTKGMGGEWSFTEIMLGQPGFTTGGQIKPGFKLETDDQGALLPRTITLRMESGDPLWPTTVELRGEVSGDHPPRMDADMALTHPHVPASMTRAGGELALA